MSCTRRPRQPTTSSAANQQSTPSSSGAMAATSPASKPRAKLSPPNAAPDGARARDRPSTRPISRPNAPSPKNTDGSGRSMSRNSGFSMKPRVRNSAAAEISETNRAGPSGAGPIGCSWWMPWAYCSMKSCAAPPSTAATNSWGWITSPRRWRCNSSVILRPVVVMATPSHSAAATTVARKKVNRPMPTATEKAI